VFDFSLSSTVKTKDKRQKTKDKRQKTKDKRQKTKEAVTGMAAESMDSL
jgi:hypothetical protein